MHDSKLIAEALAELNEYRQYDVAQKLGIEMLPFTFSASPGVKAQFIVGRAAEAGKLEQLVTELRNVQGEINQIWQRSLPPHETVSAQPTVKLSPFSIEVDPDGD